MNFTTLRFDSIDSTNTEALKHARSGAEEGLCVVARRQTAGRGRHGRVWSSAEDAGLYLSVVLRPRIAPEDLPLLTLMSGVAVYDTLTEIGLRPDIKWPNDVLVGEKKICGILAEMCESRKGLAVVVGIGINLTSKNFPPELVDAATSIEAELGRSAAVSDLELALLKYFEYFYRRLCDVDGPSEILTEWERRSSYSNGRRVRVTLENGSITGVTDGLESNGALRVRSGDASVVVVQAGDVQRLRDGID